MNENALVVCVQFTRLHHGRGLADGQATRHPKHQFRQAMDARYWHCQLNFRVLSALCGSSIEEASDRQSRWQQHRSFQKLLLVMTFISACNGPTYRQLCDGEIPDASSGTWRPSVPWVHNSPGKLPQRSERLPWNILERIWSICDH